MLEIITMVLGPVATNAYLVGEAESHQAVVIDPAWDGERIVEEARRRAWNIRELWLTHAHFDHIGAIAEIIRKVKPAPKIALHAQDLILYKVQGGAALFGMRVEAAPEPTINLHQGQQLKLGGHTFEVRYCPGHTPGHVMFYCVTEKVAFCGDVIFEGSIGRTDLPGGDYATLIDSIRMEILSLPDDTRLLSGHGGETTVGIERRYNPFLL
jgi:glyoxylase-like metal-dependent hydrolase (beta-lactamase superfamily II)